MRTLVSFGNRWGGTTSGDRSAKYVARNLEQYGLDVSVVSDPDRLVYTHESWSLKIESPKRLRGLIRNEWLAGFSPSCKDTTVKLVDLEAKGDENLEGTAVLTDQFVSVELYDDLVREGVTAILSFAPGDPAQYTSWAMITHLPASEDNTVPLFNLSYGSGALLRTELGKGESVNVRFSAKTKVSRGSPKTVIGILRGSDNRSYILCAHGDSDAGGPGADDNASGVAGVLEVARVLTTLMRDGNIGKPRETLQFIVWGSEYYSTEHYVKRIGDDIHNLAGVLNYDEIGTGASRNCVYFESNDIPHNADLLKVLNAVGEEYAGKRGFWKESTTNPSQGGTDSYVFLPDYLGKIGAPDVLIPSVTVYTAAWSLPKSILQTEGWTSKAWKGHPDSVIIDFSRYYHSSRDIPQLTTEREPFNMSWAVKAVGISLLRIIWEQKQR